MAIRLTCSTICFRHEAFDVALAEIAALGFEALDLAFAPGFCDHFDVPASSEADRARLVEQVRTAGFDVPTVTIVPGRFNAPEADEDAIVAAGVLYLDLAKALGATIVNIDGGQPLGDRSLFQAHARRVASGLKRLARAAGERDLTLAVETPHRNGLCRTLDEALGLVDAIAEPNVAFLLDTTHIQASGATQAEAIRAFDGRLAHVHLRDGKGEDIFYVPGDGTIDFEAFFEALERSGYSGASAVELEGHGRDLEERRANLTRGLEHLCSQGEVVGLGRRRA